MQSCKTSENDFYNNDSEFPEGAEQTEKRLLAYNMLKSCIEIHKNESKTNTY